MKNTLTTGLRYAVLAPLFIIPFLSLYISSSGFFPFITGKNFWFRILIEIAFFAWIALAALDKRYRPKFSWVLVLYGLLVVWMFIADLFAVNPHKAFWSNYERMDGWVTLAHVFLLFIVSGAVLTADKLWRKWWLTFVAATALVSAYGLLQLVGAAQIHQSGTRLDASLGNSEYLAGYFLFAIAITIWQAFETRGRDWHWLRYGLFALAGVQMVVLFGTGTRGTVVGLAGAVGFAALLWMLEAGKKGKMVAAGLLATLLLGVGALYVVRDAAFVTQNPQLQRYASIFNLQKELGTRLIIWDMAIEGVKERPLTGWGHEGYNYVFNAQYEPSLYDQEPWFDRAHNMFLDWLIAGGISALFLFVGTLLYALYAFYRSNVSRPERILLLSALVGYGIQGLVVFDNLFTYIPFAAILALAHSVRSRPIPALDRLPEVSVDKMQMVVLPVVGIVAVAVIYMVNIPSMNASQNLIRALTPSNSPEARLAFFKEAAANDGFATQEIAEQLVSFTSQSIVSSAVRENTKQEIAAFSVERLQAEIERAPNDARLRLQYAMLLRSLGQFDAAREQAAVARELAPTKQSVIQEQGIVALQTDDFAAAEGFFREAYELDTRNQDAATYVAGALIMQRKVSEAQELLRTTHATTTVDHQMLLLAYYQIRDWQNLINLLKLRIETNNTAANGFQLAAAYSEAGNRTQAIAQVRATMTAFPEAQPQGRAILEQLGATP